MLHTEYLYVLSITFVVGFIQLSVSIKCYLKSNEFLKCYLNDCMIHQVGVNRIFFRLTLENVFKFNTQLHASLYLPVHRLFKFSHAEQHAERLDWVCWLLQIFRDRQKISQIEVYTFVMLAPEDTCAMRFGKYWEDFSILLISFILVFILTCSFFHLHLLLTWP